MKHGQGYNVGWFFVFVFQSQVICNSATEVLFVCFNVYHFNCITVAVDFNDHMLWTLLTKLEMHWKLEFLRAWMLILSLSIYYLTLSMRNSKHWAPLSSEKSGKTALNLNCRGHVKGPHPHVYRRQSIALSRFILAWNKETKVSIQPCGIRCLGSFSTLPACKRKDPNPTSDPIRFTTQLCMEEGT